MSQRPLEIKISREELSKRKLFLATPMFGGQCFGTYTRSVMDLAVLMSHWGVGLQFYALFNESLIPRARNYCVDEFLRSDCTHMIFIDADIGFEPRDIMAMLALMSDDSQYDVMAGCYAKKTISWEKVKAAVDKGLADDNPQNLSKYTGDFVFNPLPGSDSIKINEPVEVLEAGTGFMMIRRSAFGRVSSARPDLMYRPDHVRTEAFDGSREIMAYFMDPIDRWSRERVYGAAIREALHLYEEDGDADHMSKVLQEALDHQEPESKRHLSEDYFFCQELRKAGGRIWICPWMNLTHTGTHTYAGTMADLAQAGVHATADVTELAKYKSKK